MVAEAAIHAMPKSANKFNVDNIRVQKILGGGILDSEVIHGIVVVRGSETSIRSQTDCKVAVFSAVANHGYLEIEWKPMCI